MDADGMHLYTDGEARYTVNASREEIFVIRKNWKGIMVLFMAAALLVMCLSQGNAREVRRLSYREFWDMAQAGQIHLVRMGEDENWRVQLADGTAALTPNPRAQDAKERLLFHGIAVQEQMNSPVPPLLFLGLLLGMFFVMLRGRGKGTGFGLQKYAAVQPEESIPAVTFRDVAVSPAVLQSMQDLVSFLQKPEHFSRYGARAPKGVMLYGPPGTGKTLLARALAGEAKAPFFAMSGADFVQVYVGVGASRIRELFKKARKAGGGVIFIDEIDAIGKKRDSGNDEREQTLNALLTEMSGFSESEGIMVVAATNRLDTLDAALLREGRFDRRIEVGLPDFEERLRILQVHARKKPMDTSLSLEDIARQTALFSGAQLETLLNEAAIRAARRGAEKIENTDVETAFCAVVAGEETPRVMTEQERKITAYHEAGHALITHFMLPRSRVTRVTIIPSSRGAAGYSMSIQPDQLLHTKQQLQAMMCAALGGRAAETLIFGPEQITTGAAGDLKKARQIAAAMAAEYGMGETGEEKADEKALFLRAMEAAEECLKTHRQGLHALAKALLEKETLQEEAIRQILADNAEKVIFPA